MKKEWFGPKGRFDCLLIGMEERLSVRDGLVDVWEVSVRSSHDFLSEEDMDGLKPFVRSAIMEVPECWGVRDQSGRWVAFMGMDGVRLEMLFVDPAMQGQGLGRYLVEVAIHERGIRQVDVNEQNPGAAGFYRRMGFVPYGRSERDGQGNPFPLLHLEWGGRL